MKHDKTVSFPARDALLEAASKREQSVTKDWDLLHELIDGVEFKEVRHVPKAGGYVTEVFRRDWGLGHGVVDQVFQVTMEPNQISAWHTHRSTTDRIFVSHGMLKVVLYDGREGSPTQGRVNEFRCGTVRPALIVIPPQVWHGVQNDSPQQASLLNVVDKAYRYDDPDHWALPWDTDLIPHRFSTQGRMEL